MAVTGNEAENAHAAPSGAAHVSSVLTVISCNFLDGYVAVTAQNWFAPSRRRGRCVDNGRTTVIAYVYFSVLSAEQAPSAKPVSITERSMRPLFQS